MPIAMVSQKPAVLFSRSEKSEEAIENTARSDHRSSQKVTTEKSPHHPLVYKVEVASRDNSHNNNESDK